MGSSRKLKSQFNSIYYLKTVGRTQIFKYNESASLDIGVIVIFLLKLSNNKYLKENRLNLNDLNDRRHSTDDSDFSTLNFCLFV